MSEPRIIFAGTPDFAATHLQALIASGANLCAVYTQPDRPAGRGRKLQKSPVKQIAEAANIPVYQPLNFKEADDLDQLTALNADLMIVVAYGIILPQGVLDAPRLGCVNVHASLLPRWRGAAPIHRALLEGDSTSGVTLMQMEAGLDTGPMLAKIETEISDQESSGQLHDRLAQMGSKLLVDSLPDLLSGKLTAEQQSESLVTYAHKLEKQEGQIDWSRSATDIGRQIRGLSPWPVAFTTLDDLTLRIWQAEPLTRNTDQTPGTLINADRSGIEVSCGEGILRLINVQLPGKKAMNVADILNSNNHPFETGKRLG